MTMPDCRPRVLTLRRNAPRSHQVPSDWKEKANYIYIGRKNKAQELEESGFGNPFIIGRDGDRTEVLVKYAEYVKNRLLLDPGFRESVAGLAGKCLVCWCAPELCHGDILADACVWVNDWLAREADRPQESQQPIGPGGVKGGYQAELRRLHQIAQKKASKIRDYETFKEWRRRFMQPATTLRFADYLRSLPKK